MKKAAKRGTTREDTTAEGDGPILDGELEDTAHQRIDDAVPLAAEMARTAPAAAASDADKRTDHRIAEDVDVLTLGEGNESQVAGSSTAKKRKPEDEDVSDGIMAALNKLRQQ